MFDICIQDSLNTIVFSKEKNSGFLPNSNFSNPWLSLINVNDFQQLRILYKPGEFKFWNTYKQNVCFWKNYEKLRIKQFKKGGRRTGMMRHLLNTNCSRKSIYFYFEAKQIHDYTLFSMTFFILIFFFFFRKSMTFHNNFNPLSKSMIFHDFPCVQKPWW